jgi:threonine aldolase
MIDLRSDTVTLPPPGMRECMAAAELGDDVFGEDPTVRALEARAANLMGKEAALFVPSGTMGNLLATLTHTVPGDELICTEHMHTFSAEGGGAARFAGVSTRLIPSDRGRVDPADVVSAVRADDPHCPRTSLLWLEQPQNGWIMAPDNVRALGETARHRGLAVHLDGARIFNAAVALGTTAAALAAPADTVMFCVSKGLAAPAGSLLAGPADFIRRARRNRKVLGGGMRQAGVLAAAALFALDRMVARLAEDHANARALAGGLRQLGWRPDRESPETNIFFVEPPERVDAATLVAQLERAGVKVFRTRGSARTLRLVTHYGIERDDIDRALDAFAALTS